MVLEAKSLELEVDKVAFVNKRYYCWDGLNRIRAYSEESWSEE